MYRRFQEATNQLSGVRYMLCMYPPVVTLLPASNIWSLMALDLHLLWAVIIHAMLIPVYVFKKMHTEHSIACENTVSTCKLFLVFKSHNRSITFAADNIPITLIYKVPWFSCRIFHARHLTLEVYLFPFSGLDQH